MEIKIIVGLTIYCCVACMLYYPMLLYGCTRVLLHSSFISAEQQARALEFWKWSGWIEGCKAYMIFVGLLREPRLFLLFLYSYDFSSLSTLCHYFMIPVQSWNFWLSWMLCPQLYLVYLGLVLATATIASGGPFAQPQHTLHLIVFLSFSGAHLAKAIWCYLYSSSAPASMSSRQRTVISNMVESAFSFGWCVLGYMLQDFSWSYVLHSLYYGMYVLPLCLKILGILASVLLLMTCFFITLIQECSVVRALHTATPAPQEQEQERIDNNNNDNNMRPEDIIQVTKNFITFLCWATEPWKKHEKQKFVIRDELQLPPEPDTNPWDDVKIPDPLTCGICLGLFKLPVSTPQSHSYCASCLQSHLDAGNLWDPNTRALFSPTQLVFNRALHHVILYWMEHNSNT